MNTEEKRDNIEVRLHKNDLTLDEVVVQGIDYSFHLEQMDSHWYWMRIYGLKHDLVVHLGAAVENGLPVMTKNYRWEPAVYSSDPLPESGKTEIIAMLQKHGFNSVLNYMGSLLDKSLSHEHTLQTAIEGYNHAEKEFFDKCYEDRNLYSIFVENGDDVLGAYDALYDAIYHAREFATNHQEPLLIVYKNKVIRRYTNTSDSIKEEILEG